MKRLCFCIFLLVTLLLPLLLTAQNKSSIKVATFELVREGEPLSCQEEQTLLRHLKTKQGTLFSQTDFDSDLKFLSQEFERVEPELDFKTQENVAITLILHPKHRIHTIHWCGNRHLSAETLQEELGIEIGSYFDRSTFNEALHKVQALYLKKSYFECQLDYELTAYEERGCEREIDITILVQEGPAGKIKEIHFEGLTSCEEEVVSDRILTSTYSVWTSWLTDRGFFVPEMADYDRCMVLDYLQNEGYADAKVTLITQEVEQCDRIIVTFVCHKGPRFFFGNVTYEGNCLFESRFIDKFVHCLHNQPFSPDRLREISQKLQMLYGSKGHIEAAVDFTLKLRPECNIYDIHFKIKEGAPYKVGFVKIFGNSHTKNTVILNESLLVPGECFDLRKLKGTEARLENVGYFECVNVYPVRSLKEGCDAWKYRDVNIEVKEASTGNISLSLGFSTLDSLFTSLELTERNFSHYGLFDFFSKGPNSLRGNGEFLQIQTTWGLKTSSGGLRWTKPYFMDTKWVVGFDLSSSINKAVSTLYDLKQTGIKVFATHPLNAFVRYGWNYRYTNSEVDVLGSFQNIKEGMTEAEIAKVNANNAALQSLEDSLDKHGVVSAIGPVVTYDSTDCPRRPKNGFRSQLSMEYAGLGGKFNFLALHYLNTLYYSPFSKGTFKYRLDARFLKPVGHHTTVDNLPLTERFFLGGDTTVRGYRGYSIGPQFDNGAPTGGISSLLASQEFIYPLYKRIDGFVFVDGGSISLAPLSIGKFYLSYGLGVRVEVMPDMPIIIGMGWPVNPSDRSQVRRFFISFGGQF